MSFTDIADGTGTPKNQNETDQSNLRKDVEDFEFTGEASEMWPIILKNLVFNVLTLSLYRFWGRTSIRNYIWKNVRFKGDPLEYLGTGAELFTGFIIALFVIFLPLLGIGFWGQTLLLQGSGFGVLFILIAYMTLLFLLPLGIFRAQKYRLSRTRWRGIRGALIGNGVDYASATLGYYLLIGLTGGLAYPYVENKLWGKMTNKTRFGDGEFSYNAPSGPLYGGFLVYFGMSLIGIVLFFMISGVSTMSASGGTPTVAISSFFFGYLTLILCMGFGYAVYLHRQLVHFWGNMKYQNCHFGFKGGLGDMIKLYVGNAFLFTVTLGLAYPITQMRFARYVMQSLKMYGDLDLTAIAQTSEEEPSYGEGLAEGFDMGTI